MEDRDKVIKGLECCVVADPDDYRKCNECPFEHNGIITSAPCMNGLMANALALLREQTPQVLTFEEVYKFSCKAFDQRGEDSPLYVECRERYPYQLKWLTVERAHEWMRDDETIKRRKLTYNNAKERWGWRCWSSRPSPEQMANAPWEADEK